MTLSSFFWCYFLPSSYITLPAGQGLRHQIGCNETTDVAGVTGRGIGDRSSIQGLLALASLIFYVIFPFAFLSSPSCLPSQNASLHNDSSYSSLVIKTTRNVWKHLNNICTVSSEILVAAQILGNKRKLKSRQKLCGAQLHRFTGRKGLFSFMYSYVICLYLF